MNPPKPEHELSKLRRLRRERHASLEEVEGNSNIDPEQKSARVAALKSEIAALDIELGKAMEEHNKDLPKQIFKPTRHAFKKPPDYSGN